MSEDNTFPVTELPPEARALTKTEPLKRRDALERSMNEVVRIKSKIKRLQDALAELEARPLPTTETITYKVMPGEDGYENAADIFSSGLYRGGFQWYNTRKYL